MGTVGQKLALRDARLVEFPAAYFRRAQLDHARVLIALPGFAQTSLLARGEVAVVVERLKLLVDRAVHDLLERTGNLLIVACRCELAWLQLVPLQFCDVAAWIHIVFALLGSFIILELLL